MSTWWRCWCPCSGAGGKAVPCWGFGGSPELLGWWGSCWQQGMRTESEGCLCSSAVGCFQCFPTWPPLVDALPGACLRLCSPGFLFLCTVLQALATCCFSRLTNSFPDLQMSFQVCMQLFPENPEGSVWAPACSGLGLLCGAPGVQGMGSLGESWVSSAGPAWEASPGAEALKVLPNLFLGFLWCISGNEGGAQRRPGALP